MKIYLLAFFITSFLFLSCSPTYKLADYTSKKEFYDDFNNRFKDRSARILMLNDSTIDFEDGLVIEHDTLYAISYSVIQQNKKIPLSDIKEKKTFLIGRQNTFLFLRTGEMLKVNLIGATADSIEFEQDLITINKNIIASLDSIKNVTNKVRWSGLPIGFVIGTLSGGIIGSAIIEQAIKPDPNSVEDDVVLTQAYALIFFTCTGATIGMISGWFVGITYNYEFNP